MKKRKAPERTVSCEETGCTAMFFTWDQAQDHHKLKHQSDIYDAWIGKRARGVYLAHLSEQRSGDEEWDAFPSVTAAKQWVGKKIGKKRLPWVRDDLGWKLEEYAL